ncbi:hypothetical protein [Paenibacillus elgii]|uniref:hypothetical protein n=1 Tax=Paenibacillus elgii TaxID=189691 RepID=UPI000248D91F|nr:hypothetical protein [Paenibacillus elgii]
MNKRIQAEEVNRIIDFHQTRMQAELDIAAGFISTGNASQAERHKNRAEIHKEAAEELKNLL